MLGMVSTTIKGDRNMFRKLLIKLSNRLAFPMPCSVLCGYTDQMRRPSIVCPVCRGRKLKYGKLDVTKFYINPFDGCIVPYNNWTYTIYVNNDRHLAKLKDAIIKRLCTIIELLA
jgi:hypothetical protein